MNPCDGDWWQQEDPVPMHRVCSNMLCELGQRLGFLETILQWDQVWLNGKQDAFGDQVLTSERKFEDYVQKLRYETIVRTKPFPNNVPDWLNEVFEQIKTGTKVIHLEATIPLTHMEHYLWPDKKQPLERKETSYIGRPLSIFVQDARAESSAKDVLSKRCWMWLHRLIPRPGYITYASWNIDGRYRLIFGEPLRNRTSLLPSTKNFVLHEVDTYVVQNQVHPKYEMWFWTNAPLSFCETIFPIGRHGIFYFSMPCSLNGKCLLIEADRYKYLVATSYQILPVRYFSIQKEFPLLKEFFHDVSLDDAMRQMFEDPSGEMYSWASLSSAPSTANNNNTSSTAISSSSSSSSSSRTTIINTLSVDTSSISPSSATLSSTTSITNNLNTTT